MATATISPAVEMTVEHSRVHSAWMWMRELLRKASKGFASGATKIKVTVTRYATTTASTVLAAGAQIGLATKVGWDGAARVTTSALGLVAKGALQVARTASWVVDKVGKGLSWFVGLFHKRAGESVHRANATFTEWRRQTITSTYTKVDSAALVARAAVTSPTASGFGRAFAGVVGAAGVANIITKGAVAAKAVSMIGPKAALLFGPASLLITLGVGAVAGLFSWLFRRNEVMTTAFDIYADAAEKTAPVTPHIVPVAPPVTAPATIKTESASAEITTELNDEGGAEISGDDETVKALADDEAAAAEALHRAKEAQLKAAGMFKPDPAAVTNAVVDESLRQSGAQTANPSGAFSKTQRDKRRTALRNGAHPMPEMPVAEPISA